MVVPLSIHSYLVIVATRPRTQAQITKNRHTTVFLRALSLATDLYRNTVVCLFLVICAWVRGWSLPTLAHTVRDYFLKESIIALEYTSKQTKLNVYKLACHTQTLTSDPQMKCSVVSPSKHKSHRGKPRSSHRSSSRCHRTSSYKNYCLGDTEQTLAHFLRLPPARIETHCLTSFILEL